MISLEISNGYVLGMKYVTVHKPYNRFVTEFSNILAQYVERRTSKHNVSDLYRLWDRVPGWPTKKVLIVFWMRR